ncbi:MAG: hypothetical protein GKR99_05075 [Rhodobacteraceae bacterium]|nr:hypothetical protein [Paracoccaceae bacterium]
MTHFWILEVLADLEKFSAQNGLLQLAEQLSKCREVALKELGSPTAAKELQKIGTDK